VTPINGASDLLVGLVDSSNTTVGTAGATLQYSVGNASTVTLLVRVIVKGDYYCSQSSMDVPICVAKPTPGTIAGGATLNNNDVAGTLPTLTKGIGITRAAVGVQYNKSGSNPQGNIIITVCTGTKTYEIKSTAISTLSVTVPTANFSGKCVINDVSTAGQVVSIDGGAIMQVGLKDNGPTGVFDQISISIQSSKTGATWFSSSWNGTQTILKTVTSGDISVQ
jgi:hypothetical protein